MHVDIRLRGRDASERLRAHAEETVRLYFRHLAGDVTTVIVRVGDISGIRHGIDKRCRVTVSGPGLRAATVDALCPDPYVAVEVALGRSARVIRRELERSREPRPLRDGIGRG